MVRHGRQVTFQLAKAAAVKTKVRGEVYLVDEKNDIERRETAVGAKFGGRRNVVPMHSDLEIACKLPDAYIDGQNRGSSDECPL